MQRDRITLDPSVMQGAACIRGMRITARLVANLVTNGMTSAEIIRNYPDLEEADIQQAVDYVSAQAPPSLKR